MRLHALTVSAFGPFAGTETVDFDELNDAGLFLLAGATGAGKTSILDAVCFALYGAVPGVRGVKALKSQHADLEAVPEVVLEFSVRERRFRVRRSPEWSRPKRRGSGTVTEKASASLVELTGRAEDFLTSRAAEVGLMISELVGMRAAQFQQVAMLPQGEFQRFLQAGTQERHDVLQHLFRTDRFARIEDWVHDHSRDLRKRAEDGGTGVRQLLHTFAERAESEAPEPEPGVRPVRETVAAWLSWAGEHVDSARVALDLRAAEHARTATGAAVARVRLEDRQRQAELVRRRTQAESMLVALQSSETEAIESAGRLEADHRAAACLPLADLTDRARAELASAEAVREAALARLRHVTAPDSMALVEPDEGWTAGALEAAGERARHLLAQLDRLVPRVRAVADAEQRLHAIDEELASTQSAREMSETTLAQLPERIDASRKALDEALTVATRREALDLQLKAALARAEAAALLPQAVEKLTQLRDEVRDRRDQAADARELVQELQARRLAGIAAELAGHLTEGTPCQVCGSSDHPQPAPPAHDPVTDLLQQQAEAALATAQEALVDATRTAAAAEARQGELRIAAADLSEDAARAEVDRLRSELDEAASAAAAAARHRGEVTAREAELDRARAAAAGCATRIAALEEQRTGTLAALSSARAEITDLLGEDLTADELPATTRRLRDVAATVAQAEDALAAHAIAAERLDEVEAHLGRTLAEHDFSSVEALRLAVLPVDERARLERAAAERSEQRAAARAVLDDPAVAVLDETAGSDLAPHLAAVATAEEAAGRAAREFHLQEQRVAAMSGLADRLGEAARAWLPAQEEFERAEAMSRLVRGMGTDNQLQMRLSAYVLATRLHQVLDAANERLAHMRDQRYLLQRTGRAARKGSQAGLGLEVVDQWTGDVRDPATLSGGETFVVSLALALGLADVVTQEAGGVEIDTLFVDEGFGTLDADTLDDVMDRLDGLRAGGRTVGVVSHVAELRTRIPAQVHVRKSPRGSTIHAETLVG